MARALIIGKEGGLQRQIRKLEAAGYMAVEVPGAVHLGRGVWIFSVEVTTPAPTDSVLSSHPCQTGTP